MYHCCLGDSNHGNFQELLRFREEAGDKTEVMHKRSAFVSPTVQNQILHLISKQILATVISSHIGKYYLIFGCKLLPLYSYH